MKRKSIMMFTVLFTLFSISNLVFAVPSVNLTDISNHWAKENIQTLVEKGTINGYENNTFKPNATITRAEFTKILISALHGEQEIAETGHWADVYIEKAFEEGYAVRTEFGGYDVAITRSEIAGMLSRALTEEPKDIEKFKTQIVDFNRISRSLEDHVARVYAAGIITGYPDGEFKPSNTATRAEASTMLLRFLDPSKRQIPKEKPNYPNVTEIFEKELLKDYVDSKGLIQHRVGDAYERVDYVYRIKPSDLPVKIGEYVLYSIEPRIEVVGAGKNRTFIVYQTVIGNTDSYKWDISKDSKDFYRGLYMNIADKNFNTLRNRNNYENFTFELAPTPQVDQFGNEIYKTYYGVLSSNDEMRGLDWKTYDGNDAYHLIFNDYINNVSVIVENAFNK